MTCGCGKTAAGTEAEALAEAHRYHRSGLCGRGSACRVGAHRCPQGAWHWGHAATSVKGTRWDESRLLRVAARLRHGAVVDPSWPVPLDGILASVEYRTRMGGRYGVDGSWRTVPLPLCTSRRGHSQGAPDCGNRWVWAATCAVIPPGTAEDVRWWHQRFDDDAAERVVDTLPSSTSTGRYKPWRMPLVVTLAAELTWWAIGDHAGVRAILDRVDQIGRKRSQGEGVVVSWDVEDAGDPVWERVLWRDDRSIARPLPARAAESLGIVGPDTVAGTYRPPYWRPRLVTDNGEARREWQEVIAPWTTKPSLVPSGLR